MQALRADGDGGAEQEEQAARELERRFNKKDFKGMTVHGQFNKGFIMASSGLELFIIDQHASDEKFNFERLQDTLVLNKCASAEYPQPPHSHTCFPVILCCVFTLGEQYVASLKRRC